MVDEHEPIREALQAMPDVDEVEVEVVGDKLRVRFTGLAEPSHVYAALQFSELRPRSLTLLVYKKVKQ